MSRLDTHLTHFDDAWNDDFESLLVVLDGVSEEEAAKLGTELHPFGAEIAGNADGSIPPWNPKWKGLPPGLDYKGPGETRPDPYVDDKPVAIITAANYKEHAEHLGEDHDQLHLLG